MDKNSADALVRLVVATPKASHQVKRWGGIAYRDVPDARKDTILEHSWSVAATMSAALAIERDHEAGRFRELDSFRQMTAATIHDVGEGIVGDVPWVISHDPRVRSTLKVVEREQVEAMIADLPAAVRDIYWSAFNLPHEDSLDGQFFDGVHLYAQLALAIEGYRAGHHEFVECFKNVHPLLVQASSEFMSIQLLYEPYRAWIEKVIERHQRAEELRQLVREVESEM